jgi:O-acetyl-ADP-ribose deacetylase (regulator of RNase III)
MRYIEGDLIKLAQEGAFEVIGHGCNCFCTMGKGLAVAMKKAWPEIVMADHCTRKGDRNKLGTFTQLDTFETSDLTVLNLYTQYDYALKYGDDLVFADYDAIRSCMKGIKKRYSGKKIGLPLIGAGLAGGDWNIISKIIEEELHDEDVTIVKLPKS